MLSLRSTYQNVPSLLLLDNNNAMASELTRFSSNVFLVGKKEVKPLTEEEEAFTFIFHENDKIFIFHFSFVVAEE